MDLVLWLLLVLVVVVLVALVVRAFVSVVVVHDHERGLRYRNGRLAGLAGPGTHIAVRPFSELRVLDARPTSLLVEGQEVLTSEGIPVKVSLAARYVVGDPVAALTRDADYRRTMYLLLQLALRDAVTARTLDEAFAARRQVGPEVREACAGTLAELGLELLAVEVRDLMVPGELKRAFAGVVAARKEGEASLERARAETATLRSLANAGRQLEDNPGLLQLRILQQLGESTGSSVVFGAPGLPLPGTPGAGSAGDGGPATKPARRGARAGRDDEAR